MSIHNRYSSLTPDEPLYPPLFECHQVVELEDSPVTQVEEDIPPTVEIIQPSSTKDPDTQQASIHELDGLSTSVRENENHRSFTEPIVVEIEELQETSQAGSAHIGVDDTDTSLRETGEPVITVTGTSAERTEAIPQIWTKGHPYVFLPPSDPVDGNAWEIIRLALEKYDKEMCKAWNGELDTILVFTGLFSAAVTAFCIEAFQNLSQNPADTTNALLIALSLQLANSSSPVADASIANAFSPAKHDVQINVLYFVSLAFALAVSSVCILGKQWIREYEKDIVGTPCDAVRVRQMRYDSLEAWKVPQIIAALPVILIAALLLFFTGLLIQLWNATEHTTAITVSVIVALTAFLVVVTTLAPAYCGNRHNRTSFVPFRSPQAWLCLITYQQTKYWFDRVFHGVYNVAPTLPSWNAFDLRFLEVEKDWWYRLAHDVSSVHRALRWTYHTLSNSAIITQCVGWCLQSQDTLPENLVYEYQMERLASYVISREESIVTSHWPERVWYYFSIGQFGRRPIGNPVGRYQVEMLIRASNQAAGRLHADWGKEMYEIDRCCLSLCYSHAVFDHVLAEDAQYQHEIHDQIYLMLDRVFTAFGHFPSDSTSLPNPWHGISLLERAFSFPISPLSLQVARYILVHGAPNALWKRKSISFALAMARQMARFDWKQLHLSERPFVVLDKVILGLWSEQEGGIEGRTEESLKKWQVFRSNVLNNCGVGLAGVNGHLPTWLDPSATQLSGPSTRLDRFLSVLRMDWGATSATESD